MIRRVGGPALSRAPSALRAGAEGGRDDPRIWWFSFASFSGLVLENRFGTPAMAVCLLAWVAAGCSAPRRTLGLLRVSWLPWATPALTVLSCLWSIEPALTLRMSIELVLFTAVAIIAASLQSLASFVSSFSCALFLGLVASALFGQTTVIGTTGEIALVGIFGSKNNFASFVCLMLLAGAAILGDPQQPRRQRVVAGLGLLLSPMLLIKAHSLGALVTAGASVAVVLFILFLARLPRRRRAPALVVTLVLGACVASLAILYMAAENLDIDSLIVSMGKDPGLTGRGFLWSRAREYMAERPLLGVGFQAFWVQGHIEAEGLWAFAQIEERGGFHFHNSFYEAGVELGWCGIVLLLGTLLIATCRVIRLALTEPTGGTAFLLGLFVFLIFRLTVEVDLLGPFSTGCFLMPAALVYCRRARSVRVPSRPVRVVLAPRRTMLAIAAEP